MNPRFIFETFLKLLPYLTVTLEYVSLSLLFGTLLGFLAAAAKLGRNRPLRWLANAYTTILRCTPSVVLLFLVFFILPAVMRNYLRINVDAWPALFFVVVTFTLFLGASQSEVMRGAYLAVDRGQFEAGVSVGMTEWQSFRRVVLPQAFFFALPNLTNTVIYLFKEGSLAFTIGVVDIMGKAYLVNATNFGLKALDVYLALALIYWPLSVFFEWLGRLLERRFGYTQVKPEAGKTAESVRGRGRSSIRGVRA
ncbi:MAG: amino acid ABC transporter permease [Planctomycetota bacterium]|jgi:L-cystine transport system permease protein|nr:amino acid ABC transporter permease [Planctomycetota bacterium]